MTTRPPASPPRFARKHELELSQSPEYPSLNAYFARIRLLWRFAAASNACSNPFRAAGGEAGGFKQAGRDLALSVRLVAASVWKGQPWGCGCDCPRAASCGERSV